MKFLSISAACRCGLSSPYWKKFFFSAVLDTSLAKELKQEREKQGLSIVQIATKLHVPNAVIVALEEGDWHTLSPPSLLDPGYCRLVAIAYARSLHLDSSKIDPLLPPPASLRPAYTTFIKKLSLLQRKPQRTRLIRQRQLNYSLNDVKCFLFKFVKIVTTVVILLYLWGLVRHLTRILHHSPDVLQSTYVPLFDSCSGSA